MVPEKGDHDQYPRANPIPFEQFDASLSIHCIVGFLEVNEDPIESLLLKVGKLLCQFGLHHCGATSSSFHKTVEVVVEVDHLQPIVYKDLNGLPKGLKESYTLVVATPFWDEDDNHPAHLLWDAPVHPILFG